MNAVELQALNDSACAAQLAARVAYGEAIRAFNTADPAVQNECGCINRHIVEAFVFAGIHEADPAGDSATMEFESVRLPYCLRVKP